MSQLTVVCAEHRAAVDDDAGTNARADSDVHEIRQPLSPAPATFGQRGRIHIGIDTRGYLKAPRKPRRQLRIGPTGFRRAGHPAKSRRTALQIQRAKCRNAEGGEIPALRAPIGQCRLNRRQRERGVQSWQLPLHPDVPGAGAEHTDALGAAQLHAGQ